MNDQKYSDEYLAAWEKNQRLKMMLERAKMHIAYSPFFEERDEILDKIDTQTEKK